MDGKFHGRRPVGRPRLSWEDNIRRRLLVVAEYMSMEETSRGLGTAEEARARCGLWRYWRGMKEEEKKTMMMMMMMNNLTSHGQYVHQTGNMYIKRATCTSNGQHAHQRATCTSKGNMYIKGQHKGIHSWRLPLRLPVSYIRASIGCVSE